MDPGGEVVDVEEALEEVGILDLVLQLVEDLDLAVDEGLQPSREVDEDLDLLFVAAAEELGRLDDGGDGGFLGPCHLLSEQVEGVGSGGAGLRRMGRAATASLLRSCSTTRCSSAWPWALARRSARARSSTWPATRLAPR